MRFLKVNVIKSEEKEGINGSVTNCLVEGVDFNYRGWIAETAMQDAAEGGADPAELEILRTELNSSLQQLSQSRQKEKRLAKELERVKAQLVKASSDSVKFES